jgi:hypothetical protein
MLLEHLTGKMGWPAVMPVVLVSVGLVFCGTAALARDTGSARGVHKAIVSEEARLIAGLRKQDVASVNRSASVLGLVADQIKEKDRSGGAVGPCDFAALALANVAIFVAHGVRGGQDWRNVTLDVSVAEADSFAKDMDRCEREIAVRHRDHRGLAKVLKALSKNG